MQKVLLLTVDHHFARSPDGNVWVEGLHDKMFWNKYLSVFDKIYALVRIKDASFEQIKSWNYILSSCDGVEFVCVPFFQGPKEYLRKYLLVKKAIKSILQKNEISCAIFRLPSTIGFAAVKYFKKTGKPYSAEIVADLSDPIYYKNGLVRSCLMRIWKNNTKKVCLEANGVSYVTEKAIQVNFPPNPNGFTTHYSSIDIAHDFYYKRNVCNYNTDINLIHVSTLTSDTKGHATLLKVVKCLREHGYCVNTTIVGGGRYKDYYENLANDLGINEHVYFTGHVGEKKKLRELLINSDIFVFPTQTEGLPRVVIEAMACSLPCISTPTGGIPELLEDDYLLDYNDVDGYVKKIISLIDNPNVRKAISERNYRKAQEYEYTEIAKRRTEFYSKLKYLS